MCGGGATVEIGYTQPDGLDGNFQSACVTCARTRIVGKFGDIPNITVIMGKQCVWLDVAYVQKIFN